MKIRRVGAKLFNADGQTDRHDEAKSHFSQFVFFYGIIPTRNNTGDSINRWGETADSYRTSEVLRKTYS
jgi:hypothetical protein